MKMLVTKVSVIFVYKLGIPALQSGFRIHLAKGNLTIGNPLQRITFAFFLSGVRGNFRLSAQRLHVKKNSDFFSRHTSGFFFQYHPSDSFNHSGQLLW